jgi:hypothetical protein
MAERTRFGLVLEPLVGVDGWRALKAALKTLLRAFGLKCISVRVHDQEKH